MPRNSIYNDKVSRAHNYLNHHKLNQTRYNELMAMPQISINEMVRSSIVIGSEFKQIDINEKQFIIVLFDQSDMEIAFHATGTILDDVVLNKKPSVQFWIWKSVKPKHKAMLADLSQQILLEYLLERFNIIASDNHANLLGRNYWNEMASIVIDKALYVYRYKRLGNSIQELANHEDLVTNRFNIWGDGPDFSDVLLVLTDEEVYIR